MLGLEVRFFTYALYVAKCEIFHVAYYFHIKRSSNSLSLGYEALRHGDFPSHVDDSMVFIQNEKAQM